MAEPIETGASWMILRHPKRNLEGSLVVITGVNESAVGYRLHTGARGVCQRREFLERHRFFTPPPPAAA